MKYYGVFVDGKLAKDILGCYPLIWITKKNASCHAKDVFSRGEYDIAEIRITRVRKAKKASKK